MKTASTDKALAFGRYLKTLMHLHWITPNELSRWSNIPEETIRKIVNGEKIVTLTQAMKIAKNIFSDKLKMLADELSRDAK